MAYDAAVNRRARLKLVGIFLVFFAPLFAALLLYLNPETLHLIASQSTNRGALISPPRMLDPLAGVDENNQALDSDLLKGKWTMLYWGSEKCDIYCEAGLFKLRQTRLALGRERTRVQTMYITLHAPAAGLQPLKRRNPKLHIARIDAESLLAGQMQAFAVGGIYLIDTRGNMILKYDDTATARDIFNDIKSLLRASKIG